MNRKHRTQIEHRKPPNGREANTRCTELGTSIHLNVSFLAQTGEPAFLHRLCFFAGEFFLNFIANLGKRSGYAALSTFDFENVIVTADLDDVADFTEA